MKPFVEPDDAARPPPARFVWTVVLAAMATALGVLARSHFAQADVVMLYLLVIVTVAARFGRGPSLLASALSVLAYDFFFVEPIHTFAVDNERNLLTFATLFVVGLLISAQTDRLRTHEAAALEREKRASAAELKARTEELRSALLSAVSHDLRTPLAAITGAATTLRDRGHVIDAAQRADLLETVCEEAERLERLVANLLQMTRLESGEVRLRREWVPLEELIGSALNRLERQLDGRTVTTSLADDAPLVSVDPVLIAQVLFNLLENAAKHTPAGTPITLAVSRAASGVQLDVADRGPGVRSEDAPRVFEKFYRGAHHGVAGAGLGLAISRAIVDAHGGVLSVHAREGGGAVFRVLLPDAGEAPSVPAELGSAP